MRGLVGGLDDRLTLLVARAQLSDWMRHIGMRLNLAADDPGTQARPVISLVSA